MANINISFDTDTKAMKATIDGKEVKNVVGVNLNPSYSGDGDEYSCSIVSRYDDQDTNITTYTQMFAAETAQAKEALARKDGTAAPSEQFPGFVEHKDTSSSKAHQDIAKYFAG